MTFQKEVDVLNDVWDEINHRLRTDAVLNAGDIQIGAVELKDWDSTTRADIHTVGSMNALLVQDVEENQRIVANIYNQINISSSTESTIATYTVPSGKIFKLKQLVIGGNSDGTFKLEVGGSTWAIFRNSASERTKSIKFNEVLAGQGIIINIKCYNESHQTRTFEATMFGFIRNS